MHQAGRWGQGDSVSSFKEAPVKQGVLGNIEKGGDLRSSIISETGTCWRILPSISTHIHSYLPVEKGTS